MHFFSKRYFWKMTFLFEERLFPGFSIQLCVLSVFFKKSEYFCVHHLFVCVSFFLYALIEVFLLVYYFWNTYSAYVFSNIGMSFLFSNFEMIPVNISLHLFFKIMDILIVQTADFLKYIILNKQNSPNFKEFISEKSCLKLKWHSRLKCFSSIFLVFWVVLSKGTLKNVEFLMRLLIWFFLDFIVDFYLLLFFFLLQSNRSMCVLFYLYFALCICGRNFSMVPLRRSQM